MIVSSYLTIKLLIIFDSSSLLTSITLLPDLSDLLIIVFEIIFIVLGKKYFIGYLNKSLNSNFSLKLS